MNLRWNEELRQRYGAPPRPRDLPRAPIALNGASITGFGQAEVAAAASAPSPWTVAIVTSVLGAAAGWALEEIATHARGRRR